MSNIEEMERCRNQYGSVKIFDTEQEQWILRFMFACIDTIKDLHEENCKLWKALAEMGYKEDIKEKFIPDKEDWEYPYEPNE